MSPSLKMPALEIIPNGKLNAANVDAFVHIGNARSGLLVPRTLSTDDRVLLAPP